jgi:hypothetical protein
MYGKFQARPAAPVWEEVRRVGGDGGVEGVERGAAVGLLVVQPAGEGAVWVGGDSAISPGPYVEYPWTKG